MIDVSQATFFLNASRPPKSWLFDIWQVSTVKPTHLAVHKPPAPEEDWLDEDWFDGSANTFVFGFIVFTCYCFLLL